MLRICIWSVKVSISTTKSTLYGCHCTTTLAYKEAIGSSRKATLLYICGVYNLQHTKRLLNPVSDCLENTFE